MFKLFKLIPFGAAGIKHSNGKPPSNSMILYEFMGYQPSFMPAFHGFPIAMFDHDLECKLKIARHVARLFWKPTARRGVCHVCHV